MANKIFKTDSPEKEEQMADSKQKKSKGLRGYYNRLYEKNNLVGDKKVNKVPFAVVEAYKNIRIRLMSILSEMDGKIVAFSSPNASEGKSTTAVNIAITLSQLNKKVVIVDADVRRATVNKKLRIENEKGCSDILAGTANFDDVVKSYNANLDVLTSGTILENPSELFSSATFERLLSELREKYDYVIIDTPPINLVSDSLAISQKCDGLILIVRASVTSYAAFRNAFETVKQLNINVLGTVINGAGATRKQYSNYYKYSKYGYSNYSYYR